MGRSRTTLRLHNDLLDYAIHIQKEQHLSSIAAAVNWILGDHRKRQPRDSKATALVDPPKVVQ